MIPQKLVYGRGMSIMSTDFSTFFLELGITHAPRTKWSPWSNGKVERQNKHLGRYSCCYLSQAGNNWAKLFAFAHNTSVCSNIGTTPYEVVFVFKSQRISLKFGLVRQCFLSVPALSISTKSYACERKNKSFRH